MEKKTAILFGATGLTGTQVLKNLIRDERYEKIKVFTRSAPEIKSPKIKVFNTSLEDIDRHGNEIRGHDLFCCLGTTIKKAGSRRNFRKVDYEFVVKIAGWAAGNEVPCFLVVSSIGANPDSSNFYLRTKGEMERDVLELGFNKAVILRPSMLLGKRGEFRFAEEAGKVFMRLIRPVLRGKLKKYRAIEAGKVAVAMVELANIPATKVIFESDEISLLIEQV
jgi:uncharacterized protein YbjT (DUF2867 family)